MTEGGSRCRSSWVNILDDTESDAEVSDSGTESGDLGEKSLGTLEVLEKMLLFFIEVRTQTTWNVWGDTWW